MAFYILGAVTVLGAAAAMSLRNIVHCVLALTLGFVGLAMVFLELGAQFVGFTQVLVYVGAVAILAVFVIMMTRSAQLEPEKIAARNWAFGFLVALAVFGVLAWAVTSSGVAGMSGAAPESSVAMVGDALLHRYALPLEIAGLLLTAALIGAVLVAMPASSSTPAKRGEQ